MKDTMVELVAVDLLTDKVAVVGTAKVDPLGGYVSRRGSIYRTS
jgi:hypothetical protein